MSVLRKIDPSLASMSITQNKLGQVKDFASLATTSQTQGVPIAEVSGATAEQKATAAHEFKSIANKILKRLGK